MCRFSAVLALLGTLLLALTAHAQLTLTGAGKGPSACATGYVGLGDLAVSRGLTDAVTYTGFRGYNAAYLGKAVNLVRASDSAAQDFNILCGGVLDTASIATFCNATTCTITKKYDQRPAALNPLQAIVAQQPSYVASCGAGAKPCGQFSGAAAQLLTSAGSLVQAQPYTMIVVARRTSTSSDQTVYGNGATALIDFYSILTDIKCASTTALFAAGATENAFHAIQFVANGASSNCQFDTTATAGNAGTVALSSTVRISNGVFTGQEFEEGVFPQGFAAGDLTAFNSNIAAYWGY